MSTRSQSENKTGSTDVNKGNTGTPKEAPVFRDETSAPAEAQEERANRTEADRDAPTDSPRDRAPNVTENADEEGSQIIYRERVVSGDGTVSEKVHGPMPVADWPAYEKEHNL